MTKVTKKENFKRIIEVLEAQGKDELVKVMEHEIELIEKKATSGKMTKTQEANESISSTTAQIGLVNKDIQSIQSRTSDYTKKIHKIIY